MIAETRVIDNRPRPSPMALAMEWVAKITTVALEMVLPVVGGAYLDNRFSTQYWAPLGVVFGMALGMWHLLQMTRTSGSGGKGTSGGPSDK